MDRDQAKSVIEAVVGSSFSVVEDKDGSLTLFRLLAVGIPAGVVTVEDRFFDELSDPQLTTLLQKRTVLAATSALADPASVEANA